MFPFLPGYCLKAEIWQAVQVGGPGWLLPSLVAFAYGCIGLVPALHRLAGFPRSTEERLQGGLFWERQEGTRRLGGGRSLL